MKNNLIIYTRHAYPLQYHEVTIVQHQNLNYKTTITITNIQPYLHNFAHNYKTKVQIPVTMHL
jgi:hypothetical protein